TGLVAALFALMVQIALGAIVPAADPGAAVASAEVLCHTGGPNEDGAGVGAGAPPLDGGRSVRPRCWVTRAAPMPTGRGRYHLFIRRTVWFARFARHSMRQHQCWDRDQWCR